MWSVAWKKRKLTSEVSNRFLPAQLTEHETDSSGEVRVLCHGGGEQMVSDWSRIEDGRWNTAIWLSNFK